MVQLAQLHNEKEQKNDTTRCTTGITNKMVNIAKRPPRTKP